MRYALVGYGRMGQAIQAIAARRGHELVAVVDPAAEAPNVSRRLNSRSLTGVEVAFEFTAPSSAQANVLALLDAGVGVVCGTTGWDTASPGLEEAVRAAKGGLLVAPNFSIGMNLFCRVVAEAARTFGAATLHDPFVLEAHHRGKADAPSGTARRLGELILAGDARYHAVHAGNPPGPLGPGTVHVASVRAGHEPGTHTVGFDGEDDVVTLTHRARGRGGFALGAVLGGEWLVGRRGMHGFDEVVEHLLEGGAAHRRGGRS